VGLPGLPSVLFLTYVTQPGGRYRNRPGTLHSDLLNRRPQPLPGSLHRRGRSARDQTRVGPPHADCLLEQGIRHGWFTADEAYGDNPGSRAWLEGQQINYVMTISCDTQPKDPTGRCG
jgi:hypothetical protein